jgi:hypothetical protein
MPGGALQELLGQSDAYELQQYDDDGEKEASVRFLSSLTASLLPGIIVIHSNSQLTRRRLRYRSNVEFLRRRGRGGAKIDRNPPLDDASVWPKRL